MAVDAHVFGVSHSLAGLTSCIFVLFDEVMPVFAKTSTTLGGLSFHSNQIGVLLTIQGVTLLVFQVFVYPILTRRLTIVNLYRHSLLACMPVMLLWPAVSYTVDSPRWVLWTFAGSVLTLKVVVAASMFTSVVMLVANSAPPACLGLVNGIGQSLSSLARCLGPLAGGSLWAFSTSLRVSGHQFLVYLFLVLLCVVPYVLSRTFPVSYNKPRGRNSDS